jgi:hypothetical protein
MHSPIDGNDGIPPVLFAIPFPQIRGEDEEDTFLLKEMAEMATRYLRSFDWCIDIEDGYFTDGVGGVVGMFLFRLKIRGFAKPQWLWVFMGNIPSAYLLVGKYTNPRAALEKYIQGLEQWVREAEHGKISPDMIPIELSPSPENLSKALGTIASLRESILPNIRCE